MIEISKENYYTPEADSSTFSVSQYKLFKQCEAKALAKVKNQYRQADNEAFLLGKYIHAWSEGTLEQFKTDNPGLFISRGATKGQLKSTYQVADKMIKTLSEDKVCNNFLQGEKEVIIQGELFGVKWRGMVDILNINKGFFGDLKTTQGIYKKYSGLNFIEQYGYIEQMAVYRELIKQQFGVDLVPYIIAVTKEDIPDKAVIRIDKGYTDNKLQEMELYIERFQAIKEGKVKPVGCGVCDYCKSIKKVSKILSLRDL
jgi:hypothetical protein